jgi:heptaprenylglyceryl phosphate synthase
MKIIYLFFFSLFNTENSLWLNNLKISTNSILEHAIILTIKKGFNIFQVHQYFTI